MPGHAEAIGMAAESATGRIDALDGVKDNPGRFWKTRDSSHSRGTSSVFQVWRMISVIMGNEVRFSVVNINLVEQQNIRLVAKLTLF